MKEDKFWKEQKRVLPLLYLLFGIAVLASISAPWIGLCLVSTVFSISSTNEDIKIQKTGKALFYAGLCVSAAAFVIKYIFKLY